jgi:DNA-binding IclR family transcriptional regulator
MSDQPDKYPRKDGVAAVERAISILAAFDDREPVLSLAQLHARTKIYKSTLLRLMASLLRFGYLRQCEDGRYMIGAASLRLAGQYQRSLQPAEMIMPVLRRLVNSTEESASFNVREGNLRVCLYRIDSPQGVRDHVRVGDCLELHRGSGGKVLLAFSGEPGKAYDEIRRSVTCTSTGERYADTAAVACPVFSATGLAGSLTVSGPSSRFDAKTVRRFEKLLLDSAVELSHALGGETHTFAAVSPRPRRAA